ncbi:hypothetical protein HPB49_003366 [Dermacentor silvarum]|uniref:Uncharacterized protein n=1 Tax=Dermacentor silvarum TaxID=543639 RepID=A0ACB8CD57_DERSI|nr:hypothetical protein HPB49_003366 [Dermacentor silvarum]
MAREVQQLRTEIEQLRESVSVMNTFYEEMKRKNELVTGENKSLQKCNDQLTAKIADMEQRSRINNIEIKGVPAKKGEDCTDILRKMGDVIGCPVHQADIDAVHRHPDDSLTILSVSARHQKPIKGKPLMFAFRQDNIHESPTTTSRAASTVARRSHFLAASGDAIAPFLSGVLGAHRVRPNLRRNVVAVDTLPGEDLTALLAVRVICDVLGLESSVPVVAVTRSGDAVTLRFAGDDVPEEILLFRRRLVVRPRLPRPLQCGRCGLFGHATGTCSRELRCLQCARRHPTSCCTVERLRCLRCGVPHAATDPRCPQWQLERRIAANLASSKPRITRKQALELARSSGSAATMPPNNVPMASGPRSCGQLHHSCSWGSPILRSSTAARKQAAATATAWVIRPLPTAARRSPPERQHRLQASSWSRRSPRRFAPSSTRSPPTRRNVTCVWQHWQCMTPWFSMASTPREQRPRIVQWNVRSMRRRHPELADGALLDECDVLALQETSVRAGELNLPCFVAYHSATSCQQAPCTASQCVDPSHPGSRSRASLYQPGRGGPAQPASRASQSTALGDAHRQARALDCIQPLGRGLPASWSSLCYLLNDPRARSRPSRILGAVLRPRVPRCPALSIAVARSITNAQLARAARGHVLPSARGLDEADGDPPATSLSPSRAHGPPALFPDGWHPGGDYRAVRG